MSRCAHPIFARLYPRMAHALDRGGLTVQRHRLLAGLTGEVIEIGAGHGANFAHYPTSVTRVLAVEPEPRLRALARSAAEQAPLAIDVVDGLAEDLPVADRRFDAAVFSLVLCSVPDPAAALREAHRVLVAGGKLRLLEHVRADTPGLVRIQRMLDATVWPAIAGGCHTGRDLADLIQPAGFDLDELERINVPAQRSPFSLHINARAHAQQRHPSAQPPSGTGSRAPVRHMGPGPAAASDAGIRSEPVA